MSGTAVPLLDLSPLSEWGDPVAVTSYRLCHSVLPLVLRELLSTISVGAAESPSSLSPESIDLSTLITMLGDVLGSFQATTVSAPTPQSNTNLWAMLPLAAIVELVQTKGKHILLLIKRHFGRPLWVLIASFVRRAIGDMTMQLQVAIAAMHVAVVVVHKERAAAASGEGNGGDALFSNRTAVEAMDCLADTLCADMSSSMATTAEHNQKLFFAVAEAMQLHPSDYLKLMREAGSILATSRDDVLTIADRIRNQGPQGNSNQERDEYMHAAGQYQSQLAHALQVHNRPEFRTLAELYGGSTVRAYSSIVQRNEGLSDHHTHLMNTVYSSCIVALLTSYQETTNLVSQYKHLTEVRNASLRSQTSLGRIHLGAQLLGEHNTEAASRVEELITYCDGLQAFLQSINAWTNAPSVLPAASSTVGDDLAAGSSNAEMSSDAAGRSTATSHHRATTRGKRAERLFWKQSLQGIDGIVDALSDELPHFVHVLNELEETSQHMLDALHGLRHDQSVTLFPLGQLAAKVLKEAVALVATIEQESSYLRARRAPPSDDGTSASASWTDVVMSGIFEDVVPHGTSTTKDPGSSLDVSVAARRSLMVLGSTVATLHDACCLVMPVLVIVQETLFLHQELVGREQQQVAFQVVEQNELLAQMQAQSIRTEEANGSSALNSDSVLNSLTDARRMALRLSPEVSALDVHYVAELLATLRIEHLEVSAQVNKIISGLRDTTDAECLVCFDSVACYCTVVELLSKHIFRPPHGSR